MIKELMVGTRRTKECRKWLIKVREFEITANELMKFHGKTSDNLKFSVKQPHSDLMNMLDDITHLLESSPLHGATRTMSCSMIEVKSFELAEGNANAYLRSKTGDSGQVYLEAGRSRAMAKEVEKGKTLMASSSKKPHKHQPFVSVESPVSKRVQGRALEENLSSLLPTDRVEPITRNVVSSSRSDILPAPGCEIELISFEEEAKEMKPSLSPEISKTMINEIEEISSSHETESETSLPAASHILKSPITVQQSVEPTIEARTFTSNQSNVSSVDALSVESLVQEETLLTDELEIEDPNQTDAKTNVERTVLKLLEHLSNDTVRRIGIYVGGGIGKTTVLKAFIDHPQTKHMFDLIIWVTVSIYWSIRKMLKEILKQLSTDLKSESESIIPIFGRQEVFTCFE